MVSGFVNNKTKQSVVFMDCVLGCYEDNCIRMVFEKVIKSFEVYYACTQYYINTVIIHCYSKNQSTRVLPFLDTNQWCYSKMVRPCCFVTWYHGTAKVDFAKDKSDLKKTTNIHWTKLYMQHFCFCPHFSQAELKYLRVILCTQKAYFSQILFTNLSKSVLVSTSPLPR